jgi:hypothetical protein
MGGGNYGGNYGGNMGGGYGQQPPSYGGEYGGYNTQRDYDQRPQTQPGPAMMQERLFDPRR